MSGHVVNEMSLSFCSLIVTFPVVELCVPYHITNTETFAKEHSEKNATSVYKFLNKLSARSAYRRSVHAY
jgi:hypothetical protein